MNEMYLFVHFIESLNRTLFADDTNFFVEENFKHLLDTVGSEILIAKMC